jgi:H+/gluconate symporter-like permease
VSVSALSGALLRVAASSNKKQTELGGSQTEHEKLKVAETKVNRRVMLPATLMLLVSIAGIVLSTLAPANDVTTQVLRISGFIGATVLSIVFVLFGYFISLFRGQVSSTERLVGIVGRLAKIEGKQTNES